MKRGARISKISRDLEASFAFKRFRTLALRIMTIELSFRKAWENDKETRSNLFKKIDAIKRGEGYPAEEDSSELMTIEFEEDELVYIKDVLRDVLAENDYVEYLFNSCIFVYIWASFEMYIRLLLEELFRNIPSMLKSTKKTLSYEQILSNLDDPVEILIKEELQRIDHFGVEETLDYLNAKIGFEIKNKVTINKLQKVYLLRNIIAHNTGIVREKFKNEIPEPVFIENDEVLIPNDYLETVGSLIEDVVAEIETCVNSKFDVGEPNEV